MILPNSQLTIKLGSGGYPSTNYTWFFRIICLSTWRLLLHFWFPSTLGQYFLDNDHYLVLKSVHKRSFSDFSERSHTVLIHSTPVPVFSLYGIRNYWNYLIGTGKLYVYSMRTSEKETFLRFDKLNIFKSLNMFYTFFIYAYLKKHGYHFEVFRRWVLVWRI